MRRLAICVIPLLLVAACSSGGRSESGDAGPSSASAGVVLPDAYTAVTVEVLNAPTSPVEGTDGKFHVVYELGLENASGVPATITRLEVLDAADQSRALASYAGPQLVDPDCAVGDCNRLRMLPSLPAADAVIGPQEGRILLVDFTLDTLDGAPAEVVHRLSFDGVDSPRPMAPVPVDYLVAPYSIGGPAPIVIGAPVTGDRWVAVNGCCLPGWPHRPSVAPVNGRLYNPQRFAIDWIRLGEDGAIYAGDRNQNESYYSYGEDVVAVADATVVAVLDEMEPNAPGVLPSSDPALAAEITVETVDGNHIVLDLGGGRYAFYAHLQRGSLQVQVGDKVTRGQRIAKLGNTGNSNAPHMHFHVMDGPSVLGSNGVPYVIEEFGYAGQVDPQSLIDADDFLSGVFFDPAAAGDPQPRAEELPLNLAVVDFPGA